VTCTATDASNNSATASFNVTVEDTTAPVIESINDIFAEATSDAGAVVSYTTLTATDLVDPNPSVSCDIAPDSTFAIGTTLVTCTATDASNNSATTSFNVTVEGTTFDFSRFFPPIDNPPTVNAVKSGGTVPVKFSLNGDQGLDIFATGYPVSQVMSCDGGALVDDLEETDTSGNSGLSYDADSDQYNYRWKTSRAWAGTCRQLVLKLSDGIEYVALFKFK